MKFLHKGSGILRGINARKGLGAGPAKRGKRIPARKSAIFYYRTGETGK
jgi:hypothetical protein